MSLPTNHVRTSFCAWAPRRSPDASFAARRDPVLAELRQAGVSPTEIASISREDDPDLFFSSATQLAVRAGIRPVSGFEGLLRGFARQALDPTMLFGMTAASAAFRVTRLASLAQFGSRPLANLLAFGAEAAVFPLATRLGATALGRNSNSALSHDFAESALWLGAMRFSGAVLASGQAGVLRRQAAMFGGIVLGQQAASIVGLREPAAHDSWLSESLALWLQFNVAGRVLGNLLGPRFENSEHDLAARSRFLESLRQRPVFGLEFPSLGERAALAVLGPSLPAKVEAHEPFRLPSILMAEAVKDPGGTADLKKSGIFPRHSAVQPIDRLPRRVRSRDGSTIEYELRIHPIENLDPENRMHRIGHYQGLPIDLDLLIDQVYILPKSDGFYPAGSLNVGFAIHYDGGKGSLRVVMEPDRITVHSINTQFLGKHLGTVLLDWWATQAAWQGREFAVHYITNPRVFTILDRSHLFEPGQFKLSDCVHAGGGFDAQTEFRSWEEFYQSSRRYFSDFTWARGKPNPALLLPSDPPSDPGNP